MQQNKKIGTVVNIQDRRDVDNAIAELERAIGLYREGKVTRMVLSIALEGGEMEHKLMGECADLPEAAVDQVRRLDLAVMGHFFGLSC